MFKSFSCVGPPYHIFAVTSFKCLCPPQVTFEVVERKRGRLQRGCREQQSHITVCQICSMGITLPNSGRKFGSLPVKRGQTGDSSATRANNCKKPLPARRVSESRSFSPCPCKGEPVALVATRAVLPRSSGNQQVVVHYLDAIQTFSLTHCRKELRGEEGNQKRHVQNYCINHGIVVYCVFLGVHLQTTICKHASSVLPCCPFLLKKRFGCPGPKTLTFLFF